MNEHEKRGLKAFFLTWGALGILALLANGIILAAAVWIVVKVLQWTNVL